MRLDRRGRPVLGTLVASMEREIIDKRADLVGLDPFVKTHSVEENSNSAIDDVVQILSDLAIKHSIGVDAPHHASKGIADPGNVNRGRGASAMKDAVRLVYTLAPMSREEARALAVPEAERRSLIRMDSGKVNIAPPMIDAKWFRLVGVPLGNATARYPNGDTVQTVEPWIPPDIWRDLSVPIIHGILNDIEAGLPNKARYSASAAARARAAWQVVINHCPGMTEDQARLVIKAWLKNGLLVEEDYHNETERKTRKGVRVDNEKRPE